MKVRELSEKKERLKEDLETLINRFLKDSDKQVMLSISFSQEFKYNSCQGHHLSSNLKVDVIL